MRNLLTRGNTKLGEAIHGWSIPAGPCCPGKSSLCSKVCYAQAGFYRMPAVKVKLAENLAAALLPDFSSRLAREIRRRGVHILRIHVSGDFFDAEYAWKWSEIVAWRPRTTFYAYTRSWRVPEIVPELHRLATWPNVRLWYSCDAETGLPENVPPGVRIAYLQTQPAQVPQGDLVFRVRELRRKAATRIPVCASEVTTPRPADVTCTSCRLCYK
jgi:hypothetical protein